MAFALYDAHLLTFLILFASMLFVPAYVLGLFLSAGARPAHAAWVAAAFIGFGAVMMLVCLEGLTRRFLPVGGLIVPLAWVTPSLVVWLMRRRLEGLKFSQRMLVAGQLFRLIGGVFLIEMARGHIPGVFAYPAGLGDLLVAVLAAWALLIARGGGEVSRKWIQIVLWVGVADFASAFFFGFTSNRGVVQLFALDFDNRLMQLPTGLIPLYLVPCAIFFHTLSWLALRSGRK